MNKYTPKTKGSPDKFGRGRKKSNPEDYVTGPCPIRREKYYAFLKHRAQAKFRKEDYDLTWEQWESLWSDEDFAKRGRAKTDLCLMLEDKALGWTYNNVAITTRLLQLQKSGERQRDRP